MLLNRTRQCNGEEKCLCDVHARYQQDIREQIAFPPKIITKILAIYFNPFYFLLYHFSMRNFCPPRPVMVVIQPRSICFLNAFNALSCNVATIFYFKVFSFIQLSILHIYVDIRIDIKKSYLFKVNFKSMQKCELF